MKSNRDTIRLYIQRQRRSWIIQTSFVRLQLITIVAAATLLIIELAFWLFPWTGFPLLFDLAIVTWGLASLAAVADSALWHAPSVMTVARRLEEACGGKHPLLSIALSLDPNSNDPLSAEVFRRAAGALKDYPLRHVFVSAPRLSWLALCTVITCIVGMLMLKPSVAAFWRMPFESIYSQASIRPGTIRLPQGSSVELGLDIRNARVPSCLCRLDDLATLSQRRRFLRPDSLGHFRLRLDSCRSSFAYSFLAQGAWLNHDTIFIVPPPKLYSIEIELRGPLYTGTGRRWLPDGQGSFSTYAGTIAVWHIKASSPLKSASLVPQSGEPYPCTIEKGSARTEITIVEPLRYKIVLIDSLSQQSSSEPIFSVDIIPDLMPRVAILYPGRNMVLRPEQVETLTVEAVDDLGIIQCAILWRKASSDRDSTGRCHLSISQLPTKQFRQTIVWDLKPLRLYPADTVYYWAEVRDSKDFGPQQWAFSDTFWFRVPTFEEIQNAVQLSQKTAVSSLAGVLDAQRRLKEDLSALLSAVRRRGFDKSLDWQQKQAVSAVGREISMQFDSLHKALHALEETLRHMRQHGMSSQSLLEKMDLVQNAVSELIDRYGDSLLSALPPGDEELYWDEIRNAVERLQRMLPILEKSLDRTLHYLSTLLRDSKLSLLAERAEKLGRQQREIATTEKAGIESIRHQRQAAQDQQAFLDDVRDLMSIDSNPPILSAADVPSLPQAQELFETMRDDLASNRMPSFQIMNQMSGTLVSMAEELRAQLSTATALRIKRETAELLDMVRDVLELSAWQEQIRLMGTDSTGDSLGQRLTGIVRAQQALRQALAWRGSIFDSLSTIPPQMLARISQSFDKAVHGTQEALRPLGAYGIDPAAMARSAAALNALAQTLLQCCSQMDSLAQCATSEAAGAEGLMSGLRMLCGKQAAINAATAELLRTLLSEQDGISSDAAQASSETARASAEAAQREIAEKLRQLATNCAKGHRCEGLQERLKQLEKEAEDLARMLQNPNAGVSERQERFLVRMLQSTLSLHRQEENHEEQRTSVTAAQIFSTAKFPPRSQPPHSIDKLFRMRLQALNGNFPPQYQQAVKTYLDSLEAAALSGQLGQ